MSERFHDDRIDQADRQAFICYAHEDSEHVDKLQRRLEADGIPVWRDRAELWPGEDWVAKIRRAITDNAFVFIVCFSRASLARDKSYQNEELALAIEQMRLRRPDDIWLIPVRFDECDIPDLNIGAGRTLQHIHRADIFGDYEHQNMERLVESILRILPRTTDISAIAAPNYAAGSQQRIAAKRGENDGGVSRPSKTRPSGIQQHETHRTLAGQARPQDAQLALDAIIVPASRPTQHLDHAITLARAAGCWLLILCSRRCGGSEVRKLLHARSYRKAIIIDLPDGYSHELLHFSSLLALSDELPAACGYLVTDLSMKRNVSLVLARMLGWRRVFFLGDEIRDVTYPDLQSTVNMLGSFAAVGLRVTDFPDNSVVCHANRETGGDQDVFVSGAALAVDCEADIGFFPDIYNEDWLFFFDDAASGRLANSGLKATQLSYYPFDNAKRAAWQEFGDVLGEGLYALLYLGLGWEQATREYWTYFLEARRNLLETIITRLPNAHPDMRAEMRGSIQTAMKTTITIKPDVCERYVRHWRQDLEDWKRRAAGIPKMPSIAAALEEMRLVSSVWIGDSGNVPYRREKPVRDAMAGAVVFSPSDTLNALSKHTSALGVGPWANADSTKAGHDVHGQHLLQNRRVQDVNDKL